MSNLWQHDDDDDEFNAEHDTQWAALNAKWDSISADWADAKPGLWRFFKAAAVVGILWAVLGPVPHGRFALAVLVLCGAAVARLRNPPVDDPLSAPRSWWRRWAPVWMFVAPVLWAFPTTKWQALANGLAWLVVLAFTIVLRGVWRNARREAAADHAEIEAMVAFDRGAR